MSSFNLPTIALLLSLPIACSTSSNSSSSQSGGAGTASIAGGGTTAAGGSTANGGQSTSGAPSTGQGGQSQSQGGASGGQGGVSVAQGGQATAGASGAGIEGDGYGWSGIEHPPAPITECSCNIAADGTDETRCIKVVNRCDRKIWFNAAGDDTPADTFAGITELDVGACASFELSSFTSGRLWATVGCEDGDCDPGPFTLSEFTLNGYQGLDFYDVSLVDGFNLPMSIQPVDGTFENAPGEYQCKSAICVYDLVTNCPMELVQNNQDGMPTACKSACAAFGDDAYCCAGDHNTPATCPPSDYSDVFKAACPDAYSYAYDDQASTYTCAGEGALGPDYDIVFCP